MKDDPRITRRSLVASAAAGATGLLGRMYQTAAASPASSAPGTLAGQTGANIPTPREQTVIIEADPTNVWDSFNPFIPNGELYWYGLPELCRECLFYANFLTGDITPWIGDSYSYNAGFTECTLKIKSGVTWSDGQPYTADDIAFSQNLLLKNAALNGATDVQRDIKAVTAVDPQTVLFRLTKTSPRFHYRFIAGIIEDGVRVVPKHIWEKQDPGTFTFNPPVYTGAYMLQESSASKLYYLWEKNPNYWNKAALDPKPEYVMYIQKAPVDSAVQEFLNGNLDVGTFDFLNQEVVAAQDTNNARLSFADPCPRGFYLNADSPSGLFATPEGRWAMSHLMDRETMAKVIWQPESRPATYPWADYDGWKPWAPADVMDKYDFSFDPAKAEALLDKIGATKQGNVRVLNGKPLQLLCITPAATTLPEYQIGENFAAEAKKVGIDVQVKSLAESAWSDAMATGDYDLSSQWICGMQFDPGQLYDDFHSRNYQPVGTAANQGNQTRTRIPELDAIIDQLATVNPEDPASKAVFNQALDIFLKNLPIIPTIQTIAPFIYNTRYWTGWPTSEDQYGIGANWWGQFLFVIGKLSPAGGA